MDYSLIFHNIPQSVRAHAPVAPVSHLPGLATHLLSPLSPGHGEAASIEAEAGSQLLSVSDAARHHSMKFKLNFR